VAIIMSTSTALQHDNALQAEQELREQARRNTRPLQPPACATRFLSTAPTAAQARRTWLALFSEMTLPTIESNAEWTAWSQQSIDETEAQIRKVCPGTLLLTSIASPSLPLATASAATAAAAAAAAATATASEELPPNLDPNPDLDPDLDPNPAPDH
jgi:hypothetical protein